MIENARMSGPIEQHYRPCIDSTTLIKYRFDRDRFYQFVHEATRYSRDSINGAWLRSLLQYSLRTRIQDNAIRERTITDGRSPRSMNTRLHSRDVALVRQDERHTQDDNHEG